MSRGHGRVQRTALALLATTRYGYSVRDLARYVYSTHPPTAAQLVAMRRAVRGLLAEGAVAETDFLGERRIALPAPVKRQRVSRQRTQRKPAAQVVLQCRSCDVQWGTEGGTQRRCWQCGQPGQPAS